MNSIKQIMQSEDPLSLEAIKYLLDYHEEDPQLDYKLTCHPKEEKSWLDITKDIIAFANTIGGYIVFGVKDITFEVVGLGDEIVRIMKDANNILQKVNKYLEPHITDLRTKSYQDDDKTIIVLFIPETANKTHMFSKDGTFTHISGKPGWAFRRGTFYVRRSGGNHLGDSRDFDEIVQKRISQFRESILGKIARVVEAPPDSKMLFVSHDPSAENVNKFIIEDSPEAIPIKGLSFSVAPETVEQEIAGWIALSKRDTKALPPRATLWQWYDKRNDLRISNNQKCMIAKFSLLLKAPAFYWIGECDNLSIKSMLVDVVSMESLHYKSVLCVANFLGYQTFSNIAKSIGKNINKVPIRNRKYLKDDIFSLVEMGRLSYRYKKKASESESEFRVAITHELNSMIKEIVDKKLSEPPSLKIFDIIALDCYLYAREDKYLKSGHNN